MITRFAPSPTGPLHLGHAYSAILAHDMAMAAGGTFLLRIEDIDQSRARPEWEEQIYDDLAWLGLSWETPVMRQSERMAAYSDALEALWQRGYLFPCDCKRKDIFDAIAAPHEEAVLGPDGIVYPGTCHAKMADPDLFDDAYNRRPHDPGQAYRLRMSIAAEITTEPSLRANSTRSVLFEETATGPKGETGEIVVGDKTLVSSIGDVVLARRDMGTSYHLSVVVDDAAQGVTDVVRGQDLFEATAIHVVLQRLLGQPTPRYHHHRLIRDDTGRRLAKRDDARAIARYRADGATPADIRQMVGL